MARLLSLGKVCVLAGHVTPGSRMHMNIVEPL